MGCARTRPERTWLVTYPLCAGREGTQRGQHPPTRPRRVRIGFRPRRSDSSTRSPLPLIGLVALLADRLAASVRPEPEDLHASRIADLEASTAAAKENVASLSEAAAALDARRADTAAACASLSTRAAAADHVKNVLHPRVGFEVSLFIYLTHLHWSDMDAAIAAAVTAAADPAADPAAPPPALPDPHRVRAVIADPIAMKKRGMAAAAAQGGSAGGDSAGSEVHPIDLKTGGLSPVEVAARLWGLIEEKTL